MKHTIKEELDVLMQEFIETENPQFSLINKIDHKLFVLMHEGLPCKSKEHTESI